MENPVGMQDHIDLLLRRFAPAFVGEPEWIEPITNAIRWSSVAGGNILFRKGEPSDCIYIVVSGLLGVAIEKAAGSKDTVHRLGPGEIVGEMGCITGQPRSATVRALRCSEVLAISWTDVEEIASKDPGVLRCICKTVVQRLADAQEGRVTPAYQPRTFALVSISPGLDLRSFAECFRTALDGLGRTFLAVYEQCRGMTPDELFQIERAHEYVVYTAEEGDSAWSRLCLGQSDSILVVAQGNSAPQSGRSLLGALPAGIPVNLVLTWDSHVQPTNSTDWLRLSGASRHFHVRGESELRRVARLLTGRGVGLVLSGGGARGLAHIGVTRALREHGVDIDVIIGTSIGALVGATIALEWDYQSMVEKAREFSGASPLTEVTVPRTSLLAGRNLRRSLGRWFGDLRIEDTVIPYSCVSTDLNSCELVVHRSGSLQTCVKASAAIPGVFPPVIFDGRVHVDGGVLNNMPTDLIRDNGAGFVVAVDVANDDIGVAPGPASPPPGLEARRMNILELLMRVGSIGDEARAKLRRKHCDVLIVPRMTHIGLLSFKLYAEAIEAGYRAAIEKIDEVMSKKGCDYSPETVAVRL